MINIKLKFIMGKNILELKRYLKKIQRKLKFMIKLKDYSKNNGLLNNMKAIYKSNCLFLKKSIVMIIRKRFQIKLKNIFLK